MSFFLIIISSFVYKKIKDDYLNLRFFNKLKEASANCSELVVQLKKLCGFVSEVFCAKINKSSFDLDWKLTIYICKNKKVEDPNALPIDTIIASKPKKWYKSKLTSTATILIVTSSVFLLTKRFFFN